MSSSFRRERKTVIQGLMQLAQPYRRRLIFITVLALLGTGADLLQPLIYRVAINDVAGLFVGKETTAPAETNETPTEIRKPSPAHSQTQRPTARQREEQLQRLGQPRQPHRRGFVAPRTGSETLTTLILAAMGLFV